MSVCLRFHLVRPLQWLAGLYVASPVEDYFLLIHLDREEGGLAEGERNLAQLVTSALPLPVLACWQPKWVICIGENRRRCGWMGQQQVRSWPACRSTYC